MHSTPRRGERNPMPDLTAPQQYTALVDEHRTRSTKQQAAVEQELWINSVRKKNPAQKQKQNRSSALPLRVIGYPLKLGSLLS